MGSVTIRSERPSVWAALIAPLYHIRYIIGGPARPEPPLQMGATTWALADCSATSV